MGGKEGLMQWLRRGWGESKHNLRISAEKMSKQMERKNWETDPRVFPFLFFLNGDVKGIFSCIVSKS